MSVLVQNQASHVEHVEVLDLQGNVDTITVQPGGRVTLARGYKVKPVGVKRPHLKITGDDKPVSSLKIGE